MNYAIFKLNFITGIHIGKDDLTDGEFTINSDTLFSALCHEAIKGHKNQLSKLIELVNDNSIFISDVLPFIEDELYIPKPLRPIINEQEGNSLQKKSFKKLKYIPVSKIDNYLNGEIDPTIEVEKFKKIGSYVVKTQARITGLDEPLPYYVGMYSIAPNNGLYFLISYKEQEHLLFVEKLFNALSFTGIGGKVSSGLGKFQYELSTVPIELLNRLNSENYKIFMTLSSCMATKNEIENALKDSFYLLHRRSGFVSSLSYSTSNLKKRDFYCFKSGSCFKNQFVGDIYDVSYGGAHPVYRYAKAMFVGVD